jgi:putative ABC transport system permease protein
LAESLIALERVNPGFRTVNLLIAHVSLPGPRYPTSVQTNSYYRRLEEALGNWRGASNVTIASRLPVSPGSGGDPFSIEGRAYGASGTVPQFAHQTSVGLEYFSLMRIPILSGRGFDARDFSEQTEVALVNETLAKAFWPRESPLGKRILMGSPRPGAAWATIVGTVRDIHTEELSYAPIPQIYSPYRQNRAMWLVVATPAAGGNMSADLERIVRTVDPAVPAYGVETMDHRIARTLARPRFRTTLFTAHGVLAFALAAFGVYSLAMYAGIRRRREFAVRAALGASGRRLFTTMLMDTIRPATFGAAVGLAAAYALARAMAAFLYGAKSSDMGVYVAAGLLGLTVAAVAAWLGGRRLLRIDPAEVLRNE